MSVPSSRPLFGCWMATAALSIAGLASCAPTGEQQVPATTVIAPVDQGTPDGGASSGGASASRVMEPTSGVAWPGEVGQPTGPLGGSSSGGCVTSASAQPVPASSGEAPTSSSAQPPSSGEAPTSSSGEAPTSSSGEVAPSSSSEVPTSSRGEVPTSSSSSMGEVKTSSSTQTTSSSSSSGGTCIAVTVCPVGACGEIIGGCGDIFDCGGCPWPQQCGAEVPNVCGGAISTLQFSEAGRLAVGYDPRGLAVGRVADGEWRVVTAQAGSQDLVVAAARPDGSVEPLSSSTVTGTPVALLALEGEGDPMLMVARFGAGGVARHPQAMGSLDWSEEFLATAYGPRHLASADLDGNGSLDVVVGHDSGAVMVVWDAALPTWRAQQVAMEYGRIGGVATGALLEDGVMRVIYTVPDRDAVVAVNAVDGSAVEWTTYYAPEGVVVEDLNEDGALDLLVAYPYYAQVAVMLQEEAGSMVAGEMMGDCGAPSAMAFTDVDGDGHQDLLLADSQGHVHLRSPVMDIERMVVLYVGSGPVALAVADLNGDTAPDFVVLNQVAGDVVTYLNTSF